MISGISLTHGGQITELIVFPACLLAGIYCSEPKDKSWIPEQVREDKIVGYFCMLTNCHFDVLTLCLSGMLIGRNPLLRA